MVIHRETLEERVINARGNSDRLNTLIKEFKPFIASVAQKRVGRYLEYGRDDELSVALMAFREAIGSFKAGRARFLSFARMVISLRLIDHYRKLEHGIEVPGDEFEEDIWEKQSVELYQMEEEEEDRKAEVAAYAGLLQRWDIDITRLAQVSPKSQALKEKYQDISRMIAGDAIMLKILMDTKRLPIKEIEAKIPIHRKKLERGRIYIIAMVLAIVSGFSYINIGRDGK
jgi:RNA polymerase sigma factor